MDRDPGEYRRSYLRPFLLAFLASSAWMVWLAGASEAATEIAPDLPPLPGTSPTLPATSPTLPQILQPEPEPSIISGPLSTTLTQILPSEPEPSLTQINESVQSAVEPLPLVPELGLPELGLPEVPVLDVLQLPPVEVPPAVVELPGNELKDESAMTPPPRSAPELPAQERAAPLLGETELSVTAPYAPQPAPEPAGIPPAVIQAPGSPAPAAPPLPIAAPNSVNQSGSGQSATSAPGASDLPDALSPLPPPRAGPVTDPQRIAAPQPSFDPGSTPD